MNVRIEQASPDGMKVHLEGPFFVMTWDELIALLKILERLDNCKDIGTLTLVTKGRTEDG